MKPVRLGRKKRRREKRVDDDQVHDRIEQLVSESTRSGSARPKARRLPKNGAGSKR
jgi:hypothetical protein